MERLQKYLSRAGVASRRHAETLITDGRVKVNGKVVTELGSRVDPQKDLVLLDNKLVSPSAERKYFLFYKPPGVVTTLSDPEGRPTVADYAQETGGRVFPVGRLDYDAEGALLLTDDGDLANKLMHPSHQVPRVYLAKVKGEPDEASLQKLVDGVRLEDGMAHAVQAKIFEKAERNTWVKIVVTEGRQHLVKRLCAAIGHPVVRLYRPAHAGLPVHGLRPGELRALSNDEIRRVKAAADGDQQPEPALYLPARRHGHAAPGFEPEEPVEPRRPNHEPPPAREPRARPAPVVKSEEQPRGEGRRLFTGSRRERAEAELAPDAPETDAVIETDDGDEAEVVAPRAPAGGKRAAGGARSEGGESGGRSFGGSRGGGESGGRSFGASRSGGAAGGRSFGGKRFGAERGEAGGGRSFGGPRGGKRFGGEGGEAGGGRSFGGPRAGKRFGGEGGEGGGGRSFGGPRGGKRFSGGESFGGPRGGKRSEGGESGGGRSFGGPRAGKRFGDGESFGGPRGGKRSEGGESGGGRSFGAPRGGKREGGAPGGRSFGGPRGGARSEGGRSFGGKPGGGRKFGGDKRKGPGGGRSSPRKPRGSW
jgi:23S rRNA pseudouridine2605 synthase